MSSNKDLEELEDFIDLENDKLIKIQQGLRVNQRVKLLPKIRNIRFLLNLLKTEYSGLSKKQKKDLEEDIKKGTEAIKKMSRSEKIREALNVAITSKIKPNRETIPEEIRQKAILVKASGEFEKDQDKQRVNDFLEENGSDFRVSDKVDSTTEGLVVENMNDPTDVKVAFRGSKMNNSGDWASNAKFAVGLEQVNLAGEENRVGQARQLVRDVKTAYGQNPNEIIGHSRGSALGILIGDAEGINTTNFNPFLGRNITMATETTAEHNIWRTTDDIASLGLGFKYNQNNFKVNSVNPLKKNVNKPIGTHKLDNFTENRNRALEDDPNLLDNLLKRTVNKSATKFAETENVLKALSIKEKAKFVDRHPDKFNTVAKAKANNNPQDQIGHSLDNPQLYQNQNKISVEAKPKVQFESGAGLFPPQSDIEIEKIKAREKFKPPKETTSRFNYSEDIGESNEPKVDAMIQETTANEDLINQFKSDLGLSSVEKSKSDIKQKLNVKEKFKANLQDFLNQKQEERDIDTRGVQKMKEQRQLNRERFAQEQMSTLGDLRGQILGNVKERAKPIPQEQMSTLGDLRSQIVGNVKERAKPIPPNKQEILQKNLDSVNQQLKKAIKDMNKLQLKKQRGETFDENELAEANATIDDFRLAKKDLQQQMTSDITDPTLIDYAKEVFPEGITNGELNSNVKKNGKLHNIWKKINGKITEEEQKHLDSNVANDSEVHDFQEIDDSDITDLQNADTVTRGQKIDDLHQDVMDDIRTVDEKLSLPNESGGENTLTGAFKQGLSPIALSIGLISGGITDHALNSVLPKNTNQDLKTSLSGGISGGIGETASMILGSGASTTLGAIGSSYGLALAPAIISGAVGGEVGKLTSQGLQKIGANDLEISTGAGLTSGATTAGLGYGLTAAIGSSGLLGSEAAIPFDLETAGLASVAGGVLGATVGASSYLGSEEYKSLDTAFKKSGASDLGSSVGAAALTGATFGSGLGTIFGGVPGAVAGGLIGSGIGSTVALANYGFHKLF